MPQNQVNPGEKTVVPLRGVRGMIADKMVESLQTAAQLTHQGSADATGLMAEKNGLRRRAQRYRWKIC